MRRKIWISSTLLALAVLLTSASFADPIPTQITLGLSTNGSITVSSTSVTFSNVSGFAYFDNSAGTYKIASGTFPVIGGKLDPPGVNAAVNIPGIGSMIGTLDLSEVAVGKLTIFYGTFDPTTANGPMLKAFKLGTPVEADFTVFQSLLSSGEIQALTSIPEPGTIGLVGTGLLAIAGLLRRKL